MSYREREENEDASSRSKRGKIWTLGAVLCVVIAAVVGKGLGRAGAEYGRDTYQRHEAASEVDTMLEKGDFADFYHALLDADPARAAEFKAKITSVMQSAPTPKDANTQMFYYGRSALADYRKAALNASDEKVREVAQSRLDLMRAVRDEMGQASCARMAIEGPWANMPSSPAVKSAIVNASTLVVKAGAEGMRNPVTRPEPSETVLNQWLDRALAAGITESELNTLGSSDLASLPPASQCNVTITLFEVALDMHSGALWQMLITEE